TYAQIETAPNAPSTYTSLPATNPLPGGNYLIGQANAKALGLIDGNTGSLSAPDGWIGFATMPGAGETWAWTPAEATSTSVDFTGVLEHEITEVMGRISWEDQTEQLVNSSF